MTPETGKEGQPVHPRPAAQEVAAMADDPSEPELSALRVAGLYLAFGVVWIFVSDYAAAWLVGDVLEIFWVQMVKGGLFVAGSAALIFGLVRWERLRWAEATRELEEAEELLSSVVEGTDDSIFVKDRHGRYLLINRAGARRIGRDVEEIVGRTDDELFDPETARQFRRDDVRVMETGRTLTRSEAAPAPDGRNRVYDTHKAPLRAGDEVLGTIGISRDITERRRAEEALARTEEKYETLFEAAPLGISLSTLDGSQFLEVNRGFQELTGYTRSELLGRRALAMDLWVEDGDRRRLVEQVRRRGTGDGIDARLRRKDGGLIEVRIHARALEIDGDEHLLTVTQDVTEKREHERELERRALRDELTGLANRTLFRDRLGHALEAADRRGGRVAVLFADLDRFKVVNDTLGHPAGDVLLQQAAGRLRRCFRDEDTVARLGGDEFGVIVERVEGRAEAEEAARRLVAEFERPFRVADDEVHQATSVGIALSSAERLHPDELIRFSDIAMYRAKDEQGSTYHLFDPDVDAEAGRRLHRENELRTAVEEGQLVLHYQPVVNLASGAVVGSEALVRWEHPRRGLLSPAEFIPLAEETGLIVPLGEWVIRTAARDTERWSTPGAPDDGLHLGINVSARQLRELDAVDRIKEALAEGGISPDRVILEITESVAIGNREAIQDLREHGLRVAVDDLGTGYASLEYLTHLEVDIMKVDRLFISGIGEDERDEAIVEATAHIAHRLGITLVAEGVETAGQLRRLRELGYDYGQGYHFATPRPAEAFGRLLAENPTWEPEDG